MLHYISSCFLLLVPVLLWNGLLWRSLPSAYQKTTWNNVPRPLSAVEGVLRVMVFLVSAMLSLDTGTVLQRVGLVVYIAGIALYAASWVMQIRHSQSRWSRSLAGFCAPACTAIVWLTGASLAGQHAIFEIWYRYWVYLLLSVAFVGVHTLHAVLVFRDCRLQKATTTGIIVP